MAAGEKGFSLEQVASLLAQVVEKHLKETIPDGYRDQPVLKKKAIVEYEGKLRASGMELFNGATYISVIKYYPSDKAQEARSVCGTLILYLYRAAAEAFLKTMGYRGADDEDEEKMMTTCGKFCETLAREFQKELGQQGYGDLALSAPSNYLNSVPVGIDFRRDQFDQYEISLLFKGEKALIFEMTMAPLPGTA